MVVDCSAAVDLLGKGELYSPVHALRLVDNNNNNNNIGDTTMGVGGDMIRRNFGAIKERLMEELSAAAVPADALANARRMVETVLRDVTVAAHALSKDALHRIKTHLVEILPSLSPALTTKMVDEADNTNDEREDRASKDDQDSTILLNKPSSKL
ncbi:hypothetical protein TIFTF001_017348 [Ficus carica]|uniref:Uncharacterized protein n=1 Tax=Ficus carica TaxID=3494 RepID=A0AA88A7W2_FICCA|nr:hypothetical protein TIFTF001_017348 [Ficus carica]